MSITIACPSCGKKLQAPDSAAGKRAKCPACSQVMLVPEPVHDAEEVVDPHPPQPTPGAPPPGDLGDLLDEADSYGLAGGTEPTSQQASTPNVTEDRRPCPMCGEMIVATAVKCRFCGEVLDASLRGSHLVAGPKSVDRETLRKFRREMHGLGGFWIFIGSVAAIAGIFLAGNPNIPEMGQGIGIFVFISGCAWLVLGIFTCLKHLWAVYVGLVLSYLSVLGNLAQVAMGTPGPICGIVIVIIVIVQAHRTIGVANKMRAAGIPLTTKV